ncbi:MAG: hypothetical protein WHS82_00675 [Candidatus Methanosuratincola sp.]
MREGLRKELVRKTIHLTGISVPLFYHFFDKDFTLLYTATALLLFVLLEYVRVRAYSLFPMPRMVSLVQRMKEKTAIAANVYFCVAAVVSIYFFKEFSVVIGLSTALLSDAAAAVIGTGIGRHRLKSAKTLEGTVAGAFSAFFIPLLSGTGPIISILLGMVFCIIDLIDLGFDDNFIMPLLMVILVEIGGGLP